MSISAAMLPEFDHEMATTRRLLEHLPEDQLDWQPHPRAYTMRQLATHVVQIITWLPETVHKDEIDFAPPGGTPMPSPELVKGRAEAVARFDAHVRAARAALEGASDATMFGAWSLKNGGVTLMTMPRVAVLRSFVMNHHIHHRGQLALHVRATGGKVPSIYGPTADENPFGA